MSYVPIKRTIVPLNVFVPSIERAFLKNIGESCEVMDAAVLYGKLVAECGHPNERQSCWWWNVGNRRGRSRAGKYTLLVNAYEFLPIGTPLPKGAREIPTPVNAKCPPGHYCYLPDPIKQEFCAFDSIDEGTDEYIWALGKSFPRTLRELADKGTTGEELVDAMKAERYFTGDTSAYKYNVVSVASANVANIAGLLSRVPEKRTYEMLSRLDADGAATALRAMAGVHHVKIEEIDLSSPPSLVERVKRFFSRR